MSDIVPDVPEAPERFDYYYDMAREICRRVRHRSHLSDDEIIVLAVVAAQLSLARYVEPSSDEEAGQILDSILDILDRGEVVHAIASKMVWLLNHRPLARRDAPAGNLVEAFDTLTDPDEPAPDKR